MQYERYSAGSNPTRINAAFTKEMLADGYAILGVSVRGTALQQRDLGPSPGGPRRGPRRTVDWAAKQPCSTGKVGMFSYSFAGSMQLFTVGSHPDGLAVIAPGMVVADTYRQVGSPAGSSAPLLPPAWAA